MSESRKLQSLNRKKFPIIDGYEELGDGKDALSANRVVYSTPSTTLAAVAELLEAGHYLRFRDLEDFPHSCNVALLLELFVRPRFLL